MPLTRLVYLVLCALAFSSFAEVKPLRDFKGTNAGFTLLQPGTTGILFSNQLSTSRHLTNQILLNGSGVAAGDVDGDGLCDLFFTALDSPNALFRNLGNFKFENITLEAGIRLDHMDCTGAVFADIDSDQDLDLVVNTVGGGTHLLFNNGKGKFSAGVIYNQQRGGMSSALADIDSDGDLDLYVANYRTVTLRDEPNTKFNFRLENRQPIITSINGKSPNSPEYADRFTFKVTLTEKGGTFTPEENGEPDLFLRNNGNGTFSEIPLTSGIFRDENGKALVKPYFSWGLSVAFRDINGDSLPDLYICNDFKSPDEIWINSGKGYFTPLPPMAMRQMTLSSMGVDFADLNGDGHDDIFVVDMLSQDHWRRHTQRVDMKPELIMPWQISYVPQYPRNTLFISREDGTYGEMAYYAGLEAAEWAWTPIFLDVDLDGYEDVLISNGFERDNMNLDALQTIENLKRRQQYSAVEQLRLRTNFPRLATPNVAFRNMGNLRFTDASREWGFNLAEISQGMALADLDNDGDMDIAVNNMNAPAAIYRNDATAPRIFVSLRSRKNTYGIGAKIVVEGGGKRIQQEVMAGGRYLSSDQPARSFAAKAGVTHDISVYWPGGSLTRLTNVSANSACVISDDGAIAVAQTGKIKKHQLFVDKSSLIPYSPSEVPLNDFTLNPSLAYSRSQKGPNLSWMDVDKDGWPDLVVNRETLFKNQGGSNFFQGTYSHTHTEEKLSRLHSGPGEVGGHAMADLDGDGKPEVILAAQPGPIRVFSGGKDVTDKFGLSNNSGWWNCIEAADINSDGKIDLIAGNLGLNTRFDRYLRSGVVFYLGDCNKDGTQDYLEAYGGNGDKILPMQPLFKAGMFLPELRSKFPTMESYSKATFREIHEPWFGNIHRVDLQVAESCVFINENGKFRKVVLPLEAQLSPCNAVAVADFDGNGTQDLFLGQNVLSVASDICRHDSGLGLLLINDGKGKFTPLSNIESGLNIHGEQSSAAVADFNKDGKPDLAVSQNGGPIKLYQNHGR